MVLTPWRFILGRMLVLNADGGFQLSGAFAVAITSVDQAQDEKIVTAAHRACPYF